MSNPIVLEAMSDLKWDLLCLVDRLFHPEKYCDHENVSKSISNIVKRWKSHCSSNGERWQITEFINQINNIPDCDRAEAEKSILEQIRKKYK